VASGEGQDPIVWARTLGCNVWDVDGNRFVDLTAGFGVVAAGHCNPFLCDVAGEQMRTHMHGMGDAFPGKVKAPPSAQPNNSYPTPHPSQQVRESVVE
jgi:4-aminobutyrate aminotransferase-like enzyme